MQYQPWITPACAGNTPQQPADNRECRDHPRVCGEYSELYGDKFTATGSPPRVRGIPSASVLTRSNSRITPACAGNTILNVAMIGMNMDHPRVCGEYCFGRLSQTQTAGSPPRVRGIHMVHPPFMRLFWITPACAGNTVDFTFLPVVSEDHPRVCGEYSHILFLMEQLVGSPPRVRGIPHSNHVTNGVRRITPACAGNTFGLAI